MVAHEITDLIQRGRPSRLCIDGVDHGCQIAVTPEHFIAGGNRFVIQIGKNPVGYVSAGNVKNPFHGIVAVKIHQCLRAFHGAAALHTSPFKNIRRYDGYQMHSQKNFL